ncbi:cell division protein CrgA [uncultured Pseudokineococcus sp.]|uniref:cell division protein CrgA n=1 Tax=uncultured Pseudokineococcus sp. TaxID=1642928 RepID=UPI00263195FB|nr:cell division protein CrgA [uncultured Pseudokineococcus sp.]
MPESRGRRRGKTTPRTPEDAAARTPDGPPTTSRTARPAAPNPRWYVPVMLGLMLLGLAWIVVWYVSQNQYPVPGIGSWNLVVGFAIVLVGFLMTTRWR